MQNIRVDGEWTSIFAVCQAHQQLESDYNNGGILLQRPSNARRNASTGVQLHRMNYRNLHQWTDIAAEPSESDDADDSAVRFIYLSNVLKWNLPFEKDIAEAIERTFVERILEPYRDRIETAKSRGYYNPNATSEQRADAPTG